MKSHLIYDSRGTIRLHVKEHSDEFEVFVFDKDGKPQACVGSNEDVVESESRRRNALRDQRSKFMRGGQSRN